MKKLCKALLGVVCLFGILIPSVSVNAQPNDKTLSELEEKIKKYDEIISKYDNKSEEIRNDLYNNKKEILDKFETLRTQWSNEKIEINNKKSEMDRNLKILIGVASALGISSFFVAKGIIDKQMAKGVEKYIKRNADKLKGLIDKQDKEDELRKDKKILVLSENEEEEKEIKEILSDFDGAVFKSIYKKPNFKKYDVIFFNNIKGSIKQEKMIGIINENKKLYYFYYNTTRDNLEKYGDANVTFANTKITIYVNLLTLLKYQQW